MESLIKQYAVEQGLGSSFTEDANKYYSPFIEELKGLARNSARPIFVGINGTQGSGKTTLTGLLTFCLERQGHSVVSMSLDDFYLSKSDRLKLSRKIHPLLATRGVPGTHDTDRIQKVFETCIKGASHKIPRFDKSKDDLYPQDLWSSVNGCPDFVIMEGWCWGARHQLDHALVAPVNDLERNEDADSVWRRYANKKLKESYEPLYEYIDFWVMLKAPNFEVVKRWRNEQERKLEASTINEDKVDSPNEIMSQDQIERFIQFYERLTVSMLAHFPAKADLVWELEESRRIINVRKPREDSRAHEC